MLISEDNDIQGPASISRAGMVERADLAATDSGEVPVNVLSQHTSLRSTGNFLLLVAFFFCPLLLAYQNDNA